MWCSVVTVENYTFTIDQFWPFFFDRCIQFVQLTKVDIRINRLVPWTQLKKYHTFPIPSNRQHNLFLMQFSFRCCLWWFITLGPWSFSNDVILNNPFFITSENSFQKGSNSLRLRCKSQAMMLFVKWISFNSCGTNCARNWMSTLSIFNLIKWPWRWMVIIVRWTLIFLRRSKQTTQEYVPNKSFAKTTIVSSDCRFTVT